MFAPKGHYTRQIGFVLVLSHGKLPTTDIYLSPRLSGLPGVRVTYVDTTQDEPDSGLLPEGTFVLIVRHAPRAWLRWLERARDHLAGAVLLVDDDIPDVLGASELPWVYRLKTAGRYLATRSLLARICDDVWVSTRYLQRKYADVAPRLLPPLYLGAPAKVTPQSLTYFYHGTRAHRREIAFLVGVVREVQARQGEAWFEILGGGRTQGIFRGIPRVRVLPSMAWPDFLAYTSGVNHAVGLAPLLDTNFNRARSHSKLYDITRCGAAGVYSDVGPFREHVRDGRSGLLCLNDPAAWVERICLLLDDAPLRARLYRNALADCEAQASDPAFRLR